MLVWMKGGKSCPSKMLEWSKECQWHCLCRVLKTEKVKVVRMKPLRIGERERASVGYVEGDLRRSVCYVRS